MCVYMCIYVTKSLCYIPETSTTLLVNYALILKSLRMFNQKVKLYHM